MAEEAGQKGDGVSTAKKNRLSRRRVLSGFVFLGRLFAGVKAPLFIDGWMHLAPEGNLLVAAAIVRGLTTAADAH